MFWSPHADSLLDEIVVGIAEALSIDDALRWEADFRNVAEGIGEFSFSGAIVPEDCFAVSPEVAEQLRQVFCGPYRSFFPLAGSSRQSLQCLHVHEHRPDLIWIAHPSDGLGILVPRKTVFRREDWDHLTFPF